MLLRHPAVGVGELAPRLPAQALEADGDQDGQQDRRDGVARRRRRRPPQDADAEERQQPGVGDPRLAQIRRQEAPDRRGSGRGARQQRAEPHQDAVADRRHGDLVEQRRRDVQVSAIAGSDGFCARERADHGVAEDRRSPASARRAGRDEADAVRAHRLAPPAGRDEQRDREQQQRQRDEHDRQRAQDAQAVLRGVELVRAQDRDLGRVGGQARGHPSADADARLRLLEQRLEVEHHDAAVGRDHGAAALEHPEQQLVGVAVGALPGELRARAGEHLVGGALGEGAQGARGRPGERLRARRQRIPDLALDVDVRVELVDEEAGDLVADHLLLEQTAAGGRPVVRVEDLPVDPDGEDRDEGHDRREHHEGQRKASAADGRLRHRHSCPTVRAAPQ